VPTQTSSDILVDLVNWGKIEDIDIQEKNFDDKK